MKPVSGQQHGALMAAEMAEQPARLHELIGRRRELCAEIRALIPRDLAGTVLVARGSSDHAAATGRYLIAMASKRPAGLASPSLISHYESAIDFRGYLVVALSQSGRTPEIVHYVEAARAAGARTLAVTNDPGSPLATAAHLTFDLGVGDELAVPATKTVTAQLLATAIIAQAVAPVSFSASDLDALPADVERVLADWAPAEEVAVRLTARPHMITVARGVLYGTALETALKLEETNAKLVVGYSAADLRHGPIAIARPGLPVLAFIGRGPTHTDMLDLCALLSERGCDLYVVGADPGCDLPLPARTPEALCPIPAVVRGQQLALALARRLGRDPDHPEGLSKVTLT